MISSKCLTSKEEFKKIIDSQIPVSDDEYIGDDGLIYCKVCGEPKQYLDEKDKGCIYSLVQSKAHPKLCRCELERMGEQERETARRELEERLSGAKTDCFSSNRKYYGYTFENSDSMENHEKCLTYAEHFNEIKPAGLCLYGNVGTGKSHYAACIANKVIENGYRAKFTSVSKISGLITGAYGNINDVLASLCSYDLVVLDDLGIERSNPMVEERLYLIVNELVDNDVAIIVTTNMDMKALSDTKSSAYRIYSRINGACMKMKFARPADSRKVYGSSVNGMKRFKELLGESER